MAAENVNNGVNQTVETPLITTQGNVQQEGNIPHVNNTPEQMMNDGMFRSFLQFMQNQTRETRAQNTGGNVSNARLVTAKQFKELGPPEFIGSRIRSRRKRGSSKLPRYSMSWDARRNRRFHSPPLCSVARQTTGGSL